MMNRHTGRPITMLEHIKQSIHDILTTPVATRVLRRDYFSRVFDLIDAPTNAQFNTDIYYAVAEALRRWEPRIKVKRVSVRKPARHQVLIDLDYWILLENGVRVLSRLEGVAVEGLA